MYRIGVDLGGTNIVAGVVDGRHRVIGRGQRKTNAPRSAAEIFDDIAAAVADAVAEAGISWEEYAAVCVGTPGSVNKADGVIEFANNLYFNHVPAKKMLEARTGKTVFLENDANCAALGEAVAGAGQGVKDFVAVTLGTGVGSGIIIDGKIVSGVNDAAGEMGHMVIQVDGEPCNCGRKGCWERYASATALIAQTKHAMQNDAKSLMWLEAGGQLENVSGRTAFDAWRKGDLVAKAVVERYIYYVSVGIVNIINTLQPAVLCVGGGVSNEGDALIQPILKHIKKEHYSIHASRQTKVVRAALGNDAGLIGAALLEG